jgi:hypothetical protein
MPTDIAELIKFKQEISTVLDTCIENIKTKKSDDSNLERLLLQVMTYYDRMKNVYSSQQSDDDEYNKYISDESDKDDDYTKIMQNRVFINPNNFRDENLVGQENELRRKLLGLDYNLGFNEYDDNSADPPFYGDNNNENNENNEPEEESDDDGDYILNNTKKTLKAFVPTINIEIVNEDSHIDYNEPTIE